MLLMLNKAPIVDFTHWKYVRVRMSVQILPLTVANMRTCATWVQELWIREGNDTFCAYTDRFKLSLLPLR